MGIYKRKQELDQENDQEKNKDFFFLGAFLVESVFSFFLFFLITFLFEFLFSYFLVFFNNHYLLSEQDSLSQTIC